MQTSVSDAEYRQDGNHGNNGMRWSAAEMDDARAGGVELPLTLKVGTEATLGPERAFLPLRCCSTPSLLSIQ